ncbi:FecR family protein [Sphingobacterium sp. SGR-19]|uniref:FecR family protein n=1 Tax=Sphingobacterium sp. SGR-19 TaxID=2710886 RepID=UPI0013ECAD74|nr:FecR family protein [Sphingobacterium sp. SGR-19]NGM67269.1 FecR family protein [Sphingobacterium sp. SGR-19]
MDNNIYRISYFLQKYLDGDISKEELSLLHHLLEESGEEEIQAAFKLIWDNTPLSNDHTAPLFSDREAHVLLQDIMAQVPTAPRKAKRKMMATYALAAGAVGTLLAFAWIYMDRQTVPTERTASIASQKVEHDVDPAQEEAILTLEGGETLSLQDIKAGNSIQMGDVRLVNTNGELSYEPLREGEPGTQHIVTTPKGGQINIRLPDGTKVWLNADSRIAFLSNLGTQDREVTVSGEAYFEVAKLADKRFIVKSTSGEIEVLGTKFNVRAYPEDKSMQTALVEGSLAMKNHTERVVLKPNQVGIASTSQRIIVSEHEHILDIIAWKNGLFLFENTTLADVGRQLGRWYNIQVQLGEGLSTQRITGKIARDVKLSQVMKMLHFLGLKTKLNDNNLMMIQKKEHAYEETIKM